MKFIIFHLDMFGLWYLMFNLCSSVVVRLGTILYSPKLLSSVAKNYRAIVTFSFYHCLIRFWVFTVKLKLVMMCWGHCKRIRLVIFFLKKHWNSITTANSIVTFAILSTEIPNTHELKLIVVHIFDNLMFRFLYCNKLGIELVNTVSSFTQITVF